jgi:hypothetical protein
LNLAACVGSRETGAPRATTVAPPVLVVVVRGFAGHVPI